jgi:hypothetical protein
VYLSYTSLGAPAHVEKSFARLGQWILENEKGAESIRAFWLSVFKAAQ